MEKQLYISQWKATRARANEMKAIGEFYRKSPHDFEQELSKVYSALMVDYRYISHFNYILAFPEQGQPQRPSDLKIVYNRLAKNHGDAAADHKHALIKLGHTEPWHEHLQKYHELMQNAHKNFSSYLS